MSSEMSSDMQREAAFDRIVDYRVEVRNLTALKLKKCRLHTAKFNDARETEAADVHHQTHKAQCFAVGCLITRKRTGGGVLKVNKEKEQPPL